jgi:hypothetical protein
MTMRLCWKILAVAIVFVATASVEPSLASRLLEHVQNFKEYPATAKARQAGGLVAVPFPPFSDGMPNDPETSALPLIFVSDETKRQEIRTDLLASMSGKCSTLKIAGRDFACRAVAYFHTDQGRANFTIALDDPTDDSHIVTFSGENGRRAHDNLYEVPIDRMLLSSKDRPKVDGLPVPFVELSAGICKQFGNFAAGQVSGISCSATDTSGKQYELQFESDGLPITVRRIRQSPLTAERERYRARQIEQLECRHKADDAKILRRDWTAYILQCLGEDSQNP